MENKPTRLEVARVYLKRGLRWHRNSAPYLSGDAFAQLCDVQFKKPRFQGKEPNLNEIKNAQVIFVPSEHLQEVLSTYKGVLKPKVILTGNSDYEFHTIPEDIPRTVELLLLQNSFISDGKKIVTLPIGIENLRWGVNGHPRLMTPSLVNLDQPSLMVGPFGPTHKIRELVLKEFSETQGPWEVIRERITPQQYAKVMARHGFVAAVRGNGEDTHRLWESLYRGRLPILIENSWSNSLRKLNLPLNFVESWDPNQVQKILNKSYLSAFNPNHYEALWMPFWRKTISNAF